MNLSGGNMTAGNVTNAGALNLSGGTRDRRHQHQRQHERQQHRDPHWQSDPDRRCHHRQRQPEHRHADTARGVLKGSGSINGTVLNSAGTLSAGNSPGRLTINGDYTQSAAATFDAEVGGLIAGSQHDVLNVSGNAYLDGTLNVSLVDLGSGLFLHRMRVTTLTSWVQSTCMAPSVG